MHRNNNVHLQQIKSAGKLDSDRKQVKEKRSKCTVTFFLFLKIYLHECFNIFENNAKRNVLHALQII